MNRQQRRKEQQEIDREVRRRTRYLHKKRREFERQIGDKQYLTEEESFEFLNKLYGREK